MYFIWFIQLFKTFSPWGKQSNDFLVLWMLGTIKLGGICSPPSTKIGSIYDSMNLILSQW